MRLADFDFHLPAELIAQEPLAHRDGSRLLVASRKAEELWHHRFADLPELLQPGDVLVVNDSRVVPARLLGKKETTGGRVELLLVGPSGPGVWHCLGQASKGLKTGAGIELDAGRRARIVEALSGGEYRVAFEGVETAADLMALLEVAGRLPLPPYIEREPTQEDRQRYQTVYAAAGASVAAPTAGLHFTPQLLSRLEARGISLARVRLDVGPGTFMPVREDDLSRHRMHPERYVVSEEAAKVISQARREGRRIVAVGTTVVRVLESREGVVEPGEGETRLFIVPGFQFRVVDVLLTNFHLPKSTLLMLVSAFLGRERTLAAYRAAVENRYRFFSYGDAMLVGAK